MSSYYVFPEDSEKIETLINKSEILKTFLDKINSNENFEVYLLHGVILHAVHNFKLNDIDLVIDAKGNLEDSTEELINLLGNLIEKVEVYPTKTLQLKLNNFHYSIDLWFTDFSNPLQQHRNYTLNTDTLMYNYSKKYLVYEDFNKAVNENRVEVISYMIGNFERAGKRILNKCMLFNMLPGNRALFLLENWLLYEHTIIGNNAFKLLYENCSNQEIINFVLENTVLGKNQSSKEIRIQKM